MRKWLMLLLVAPVLILAGCGGDSTPSDNTPGANCETGTTSVCKCIDLKLGTTICNENHEWGPCVCNPDAGGGGDTCGDGGPPLEPYTTDNNTVVLWHMDDTGNTLTDSSGHGYNAEINGPKTGVQGRIGKGLQFDGVNDMILVSGFDTQGDAGTVDGGITGAFDTLTIECWVSTTATHSGVLLDRDEDGTVSEVWQVGLGGGKFPYFATEVNQVEDWLQSSTPINDGCFHHLAFTRDETSGQKKIYIDGKLDTTGEDNGGPVSNGKGIGIGNTRRVDLADQFFEGILDEIRLSNKIRDVSEFHLP